MEMCLSHHTQHNMKFTHNTQQVCILKSKSGSHYKSANWIGPLKKSRKSMKPSNINNTYMHLHKMNDGLGCRIS